jgi:hypothetical protein
MTSAAQLISKSQFSRLLIQTPVTPTASAKEAPAPAPVAAAAAEAPVAVSAKKRKQPEQDEASAPAADAAHVFEDLSAVIRTVFAKVCCAAIWRFDAFCVGVCMCVAESGLTSLTSTPAFLNPSFPHPTH